MVGVEDAGGAEGADGDVGGVEDEVEGAFGVPAGEGGGDVGVCGEEAGGVHEEFEFGAAGEDVEIAGDDAGFVEGADDGFDFAELFLSGAVGEGEVDEEEDDAVEFEFDDEAFHAAGDVVEVFAGDGVAAEEGVALFVEDGDAVEESAGFGVFAAVGVVMTEGGGDLFGLVEASGAVAAGVDFDEAGDIGVGFVEEAGDFAEVAAGFADVAAEGEAVHVAAGSVADVVEKKAHGGSIMTFAGNSHSETA